MHYAHSRNCLWHCCRSCTGGFRRQGKLSECSHLRYCRLPGFRVSIKGKSPGAWATTSLSRDVRKRRPLRRQPNDHNFGVANHARGDCGRVLLATCIGTKGLFFLLQESPIR